MHQLARGAALALTAFVCAAVVAGAAPEVPFTEPAGPFEGTFEGTAYGARGTSAPLTLTLTQSGSEVSGTAALGEGLYVTTAGCGGAPVPAGSVQGSGEAAPDQPHRVSIRSAVDLYGISMPYLITGDLAPDGQSITVTATLDVPAFCGPDPSGTGTLQRTDGATAPAA
jgi:hypothetical protein